MSKQDHDFVRLAALHAATATIAVAADRASARELTAIRVNRQRPALDDVSAAPGIPARALPPVEADAARAQAAAGPDPLDFLTPVEPAPATHDDASLAAARRDEDVADLQARSAREAAELELDAELRRLDVSGLYDLKKCHRLPPIVLTIEQIVAIVNLMVRILTLGLIKRQNILTDDRLAREALAQRAEAELQRRKRTPVGLAAKKAALDDQLATIRARKSQLESRAKRAGSSLDEGAIGRAAREKVEDRNDIAAAMAGRPTISDTREALHKLDARVEELEEERGAAEAQAHVPSGLAGALVSATSSRVRAARERLAAIKLQHDRDSKRRAAMARALQDLIDLFEREFAARILEEAAAIREERRATAEEIEKLGLELRELPAHLVAEADRPSEPADDAEDEAEAERERERERIRRLLAKGV